MTRRVGGSWLTTPPNNHRRERRDIMAQRWQQPCPYQHHIRQGSSAGSLATSSRDARPGRPTVDCRRSSIHTTKGWLLGHPQSRAGVRTGRPAAATRAPSMCDPRSTAGGRVQDEEGSDGLSNLRGAHQPGRVRQHQRNGLKESAAICAQICVRQHMTHANTHWNDARVCATA